MKPGRKAFDCVQMKQNIQRRTMAEAEDMTLAERQQHMAAKILADRTLGPWFRALCQRTGQHSATAGAHPVQVAETGAVYRTRKVRKSR